MNLTSRANVGHIRRRKNQNAEQASHIVVMGRKMKSK